ncbi:MAG: DUF3307 domain-containing protein [candidate division WOR-3 bacterium]|jgi:hypothetical protein
MIDINILLRLLITHSALSLIFGFANLTNKVKEKKTKSKWLYISSAIYALLIYLISSSWADLWILPLGFVAHSLACLIMLPKRRTLFDFFLSQILLTSVLVVIWFLLTGNDLSLIFGLVKSLWNSKRVLSITLGFIILIWPSGYIIGTATAPLRKQIKEAAGLEKAGMWIGILERTLIYIFVLSDNVMAIAFLVTAKTIFRFGEIKDHSRRKEAEYILIGTLSSFTLAMLVAYLIKIFI